MTDLSEAIKKSSDEYKKWFNKNKKLIELLGLEWNDAAQYRNQIDKIQEDINRFNKVIIMFISITLSLLLILSIANFIIRRDIIKMSYFIAYYLGLIGSFLVSYGYLLQLKNINTQKKNRNMSLPNIPLNNNEMPIYASRLNEFLVNYINNEFRSNWPRLKIEIRKQKSLFWGFIIISISFLIQLVLQFF